MADALEEALKLQHAARLKMMGRGERDALDFILQSTKQLLSDAEKVDGRDEDRVMAEFQHWSGELLEFFNGLPDKAKIELLVRLIEGYPNEQFT